VRIAPLTAQHAHAVSRFEMEGRPRETYISVVREMIRDHLPDVLRDGGYSAIGMFDGDELIGVTAWTPNGRPDEWRIIVMGVRTGRMRRGLGTLMKQHVVHLAQASGVRLIISVVHRDNTAAQRMNERLGALCAPDPRGGEHLTYVLRVD
jgi:ribosomal protein S18 acetylase RimI-like enzyme